MQSGSEDRCAGPPCIHGEALRIGISLGQRPCHTTRAQRVKRVMGDGKRRVGFLLLVLLVLKIESNWDGIVTPESQHT